ncbi:N-acetylneuraminate synthase [Methanobrevibacter sp.]|uniref:N-acetylneuraminate synthase n=1 Tax=Methanobrevibacter sp. TaxID=66852 RepID=UPI0025D7D454|nr:N-acetylneuraminate synthase [Methanobrevibacter sp.]MBQ2666258.1 N-acetylneuraminate synthase [Methanobrevibacter sp.]
MLSLKNNGSNRHTFIIAEIGVNHNGSIELAKKMIKSASECGVDAVKFQTFNSEALVTENAKTAGYQEKNTNEDSQMKMLKKLELTSDDFKELQSYALKNDVIFISSPFDLKSVDLLEKLDVPFYKLGSGELTNFELINHIQKTGKPMIISTGMATLDEIRETYNYIENKNDLIILHCITGYPTSFEEANLNFIKTLQKEFNVPIGFSDHSPGIELPIAAVALGACVVEKHFTLDKNFEGPDHKASLNPKEFKSMVDAIRNVEVAMGDGIRKFSENEMEIKKVARKSIVLNEDISKGTVLKREMLSIKRPGTGIPPKFIDDVVGKTVINDLNHGTVMKWEYLK